MPTNFSNAISNAAQVVSKDILQPVAETAKATATDSLEQITGIQSSTGTQQQNPNTDNSKTKDPVLEKQETERKKANLIQFIQQFKSDAQHFNQQKQQKQQQENQAKQQEAEDKQIKQYQLQKKQENIAVKQAQTRTETKRGRG